MVSCSRLRQRRKVDFPHPDGPITAVTSRSRRSNDTSRMADVSPKYAVRQSACRRGRPRGSARRSVVGAGADTGSGSKAGSDTDDEDENDEYQRASPGEPAPVVVGTVG